VGNDTGVKVNVEGTTKQEFRNTIVTYKTLFNKF
jgi:hypothetical protein